MLAELVRALMRLDARTARQLVADATDRGEKWADFPFPTGLRGAEVSIAAAVIELLATRANELPPAWVQSIGPAPSPVWLISTERRPRLRARLLLESPEPLRRRSIYAPEDFLSAA